MNPFDDAEPPPGRERVFDEPWQAEAFALVVHLHAKGAFTWAEWARALSAEIASAGPDDGSRYYEHWLAALERLALDRDLTAIAELDARKQAWAEAYRRTPHGKPVTLADTDADSPPVRAIISPCASTRTSSMS